MSIDYHIAINTGLYYYLNVLNHYYI